MKVKCPKCGEVFAAEAPRDQVDPLVNEYLDLFRPRRGAKPPAGEKRLRLQREILSLFRSGAFIYYGRPYQISTEDIKAALKALNK